jgi:hypothetical protein
MKDHNVAGNGNVGTRPVEDRYRVLFLDIAATAGLLTMTGLLAWVWGG